MDHTKGSAFMETTECIRFLVQGSTPEPHEVTFVKSGGEISANCTCQTAQNGISCKHRLNILEGSQKNIVSDNVSDVVEVLKWLPGTSIHQVMRKVKICEARVKAANRELSDAKRKLSEVLNTITTYDHDSEVFIIKEQSSNLTFKTT